MAGSRCGGALIAFADAVVNLLPRFSGPFVSDGAEMAKLQGLSPTTVLWPRR